MAYYSFSKHRVHFTKQAHTAMLIWKLQRWQMTWGTQENPTPAISTILNTRYTTVLPALRTSEKCWSLKIGQSLEHSKRVRGCGMFSNNERKWAERQNALNQNTEQSSAFPESNRTTCEAKTDSCPTSKPKAVLSSNRRPRLYRALNERIQTGTRRKG